MKNKSDWMVNTSKARGYALPFLFFFISLFFLSKSFKSVDDVCLKAKGEIISISKDSTLFTIQGEERSFKTNKYINKSKIHIGDYAEVWYEESKYKGISYINIRRLKINKTLVYEPSWWDENMIFVIFIILGAITIPIVIKERNDDVRKGEYDVAGPFVQMLVKVYPDSDNDEETDVDYANYQCVITDDNIIYKDEHDYIIYECGELRAISVVFRNDEKEYHKYFSLSKKDIEIGCENLSSLADNIRENVNAYAEREIKL